LSLHSRKKIKNGEIEASFVRSEDQLANIFTKGLEPTPFEINLNKLELINIHNLNLRGVLEL
jgi:hypothetical protein